MHVVPLILGIIALIIFIVAWAEGRAGAEPRVGRFGPLTPLGLAFLTAALLLHFLIVEDDPITIGLIMVGG